MNNTLKSIGAVLAGFVVIFILTVTVDVIFEKAGLMHIDQFAANSWYILVIVMVIRAIYITGGGYLTARLAPNKCMLHAIILGILGLLINISGTVMGWDTTPHWFLLMANIMPFPFAWLGGKIRMVQVWY